jgi:DNA polymerase III alpha subunit (gram-positive type)
MYELREIMAAVDLSAFVWFKVFHPIFYIAQWISIAGGAEFRGSI